MTFALRAFSLAFLAWHLGLLFPGLAEPAFLALAAVAGLAGGASLRSLRLPLALGAGVAAFALVQVVLTDGPGWVTGPGTSPLDALPLWADRQLVFSAVPFALAWVEGWAFTGRPGRRGLERLVHGLAALALFWSQGPYHVTLYPHPLALALAFGLFLASELVLLAESLPRSRSWAAGLLVAVAGIAVLWSLLGRYEDQSTASGGGLMKPDLFQFDFAPLVRLEDQITLGENLVLLYREEGTPQGRYLRRMVLDAWNPALGFSLTGPGPTVGRKARTLVPALGTEERTPVRQEYYLVNMDPSSLLALNEPTEVVPYAQWSRSSFVNAYRVDSLVAGPSFWLYDEAADDGLSPDQRALLTQGGDDQEIRDLARQVTAEAKTPYEKASVLSRYLQENYLYSLKPGAPGPRGALKHFLFEAKKGYCSYFAFSMTLMLRSLGIPARVAVGFITDPSTTVLGFTPVRAYQAHAWVEVPFGPYGWLEFDPTSQTPAPGEDFQSPTATDPQELSKMISEILEARPQPLANSEVPTAGGQVPFDWSQLWVQGAAWGPWLVFLALAVFNEAWRHRWRLARWSATDARARARFWWAEVAYRARRARRGPRPGETPTAWALRVGENVSLAEDLVRARYARDLPADLPGRIADQARRTCRTLDRSRPRVHRWSALLFPWWPA